MSSEIKAKLDQLRQQEQDLATLLSKLEARKLKVSVSQSKGAGAEIVESAVQDMTTFAEYLTALVRNSHIAVQKSRIAFEEFDAVGASAWDGK